MAAMAGTLGISTHYSVKDRQTFTMSVEQPEGFITLAYWDQAKDDSVVMVIPRDQFDRALQAYLGV